MEKFNQIKGVAALDAAELETVVGGGDIAYYLGHAVGEFVHFVKTAPDAIAVALDVRRIWH